MAGLRAVATAVCLFVLLAAVGSVPFSKKIQRHEPKSRDTTDGLLPRYVTPTHYNLEFQPDIYRAGPPFPFNGSAEVYFTCVQATYEIVLNSRYLNIASADVHVDPDNTVTAPSPIILGWTLNADAEFLTLTVTNQLVVGAKYIARIYFNAELTPSEGGLVNGVGLYYDSYVDTDGSTKYIVAAQMEAIEARQAFPCFDEPDLKASFNITVVSKPPLVTLSNMNLERTEARSDGWVANIFAKSPIMSTYQVCIAVGDFIYVESEWQGITSYPVRIYARPQMAGNLAFAAKVAAKLQAWLEQETGIAYTLPKMDHLALPSKSGAMENWGLITYGEYYLVVNPETSGANGKFAVADVMAHELAHQWFGNLVTSKWWNDIWLNEGIASHFEFYALQNLGWLGPQSEQIDSAQPFLDTDQLNTSDPIIKTIDTVWKADSSFGGSTYPKGGAMVRMLASFLTSSTMKRGFTRYLNKYSYSSATTDDLWAEMTTQAAADGRLNPDGTAINVKSRMDAWMNQMGFPLVTVTRNGYGTGSATVTSRRYFNPRYQEPNIPSDYNYSWNIPITIATASTGSWDRTPSQWINYGSTSATITGVPNSGSWLMINNLQRSFFRVDYDTSLRTDIVNQLNADHTRIPEESRSQYIGDTFALARSLDVQETQAMDATVYLYKDTYANPWLTALKYLRYSDRILRNYALYTNYRDYMTSILVPVYDVTGWNYYDTESPIYQKFRRDILSNTCYYGYSPCRNQALLLYETVKQNPDVNSVLADQLPTVLCNGVATGTSTDWSMVYEQYQNRRSSPIREERYAYLYGLACSVDTVWLERFLNDIVRGEQIATRDQNQALTYLIQNNLGLPLVWDYLDNSWTTVPSTINKMSALRNIISTFYDQTGANNFNNFQAKYPPQSEYETEQFRQMSLIIQQNIDWITSNEASLATWLSNHARQRLTFQLREPMPIAPVGGWYSQDSGMDMDI